MYFKFQVTAIPRFVRTSNSALPISLSLVLKIKMNKSLKSSTSCSLVPSTFFWSRNNKPISFVIWLTQFFKQSTLQMWFNKNEMLTSFGLIAIYCIRHIKEGLSNFLRRCSIIVQIGEEATLEHKVHCMKSQNNFCTYIHGN